MSKKLVARQRYGKHSFDFKNQTTMGDAVIITCTLCGATLMGVGNSGTDKPSGGKNPQSDTDLCGCNPLSKDQLVEMTYRLEYQRDRAINELADLKKKLSETISELLK